MMDSRVAGKPGYVVSLLERKVIAFLITEKETQEQTLARHIDPFFVFSICADRKGMFDKPAMLSQQAIFLFEFPQLVGSFNVKTASRSNDSNLI